MAYDYRIIEREADDMRDIEVEQWLQWRLMWLIISWRGLSISNAEAVVEVTVDIVILIVYSEVLYFTIQAVIVYSIH